MNHTWKTWKKAMVPGLLAVSLMAALPTGAFAAQTGAERSGVKAAANKLQLTKEKRAQASESKGIHRQTYLLLLSEQYAPELTDDWEAAFAARLAVNDGLKALMPEQARQEQKKAKVDEQVEKLKNGDITMRELRDQLADWKEARQDRLEDMRNKRQPINEERKALKAAFDEAVASGDGEAIAAVLAKLLEAYQAKTAKMQSVLDEKTGATVPA